MGDDIRHTARQLPVMITNRTERPILARADVYRTPDTILIQITSDKSDGQILAEFLEQEGEIGLLFSAIPARRA